KIVETFGDSVLLDDKSLDRKALGNIVFKDKEKLTMLNKIMHPAIREEMNKQKQVHVDAQTQCVVIDVPLLFENKLTHLVDKIIVVYVDESVQLERLMARDGSTKEEALSRIHTQIPVKDKLDHAHAAINNNGTVEQSYEQLLKILKDW